MNAVDLDDSPDGESSRSSHGGCQIDVGDPFIVGEEVDESGEGKSVGSLYLICLTIPTGGLQVIWTAIMGQGSPFLASLGLPNYAISFIWLAGPISGVFVQPYLSILSDSSHHPWGRRRPYIIFGTSATILCMLLLPRTAEFTKVIFSTMGASWESPFALIFRGIMAAALIWALNISIQPVQMGIRALIVDLCPPHQQVQASAYASSLTGIGSVLGYASGFVDLPRWLPWLGDTQFKCLCVVASVALASTVAVNCFAIGEQKAWFADGDELGNGIGPLLILRQVVSSVQLMSRRMKRICAVQFFAWLGWFPFLFYITTYVGKLYEQGVLARSEDVVATFSPDRLSSIWTSSVRYGTLAMVLFAVVALFANIFLPFIVATTPQTPDSVSTTPELLAHDEEKAPDSSLKELISDSRASLRTEFSIPWLTLPRVWTYSHLFYSSVLFSTSLTRSSVSTTILISLLGISWALTQWAPLALISHEIANQQENATSKAFYALEQDNYSYAQLEVPTQSYNEYLADEGNEKDGEGQKFVITDGLQVGALMGVYNVSIAAPQILAAVGSGGLFWVLGRLGTDEADALGWAIRMGGLSSLVAAWLAAGI